MGVHQSVNNVSASVDNAKSGEVSTQTLVINDELTTNVLDTISEDPNPMLREATGYHLGNVKYKITKGKRVYQGISEKGQEFTVGPKATLKGVTISVASYTTYTKEIYKEYRQYVTIKWTAQKLENATNRVIGTINETQNMSYLEYVRLK